MCIAETGVGAHRAHACRRGFRDRRERCWIDPGPRRGVRLAGSPAVGGQQQTLTLCMAFVRGPGTPVPASSGPVNVADGRFAPKQGYRSQT